jgi:hypothetical protein
MSQDSCPKTRIKEVPSWKVGYKFYHIPENAIQALLHGIQARVKIKAYWRRGEQEDKDPNFNRQTFEQARLDAGWHKPGGFHERWRKRAERRIRKICVTRYGSAFK